MRVYELLATLDRIEEDTKRVISKRPAVCDKDTTLELNYFEDVLPLLQDADELKFMLEEFYKVNSSPITVEFYATFDFGTSLTDEINDALSRLGISANYSYIDNKEYFVLIR